ncbi:MAG TPA: hypothetical protein VGL00_10340 [Terracidiphilus sp.]|jgi:hypothetical protein
MSRKIALWAGAGFAVGCFWVVFSRNIPRDIDFGHWTGTSITASASLLRHRPVTWYDFILLNTLYTLWSALRLIHSFASCADSSSAIA